jgi:1,4-dihydroxy-2-naphthoyl-CoA hydrolase
MTASDPQSGEPTPDHVAYLAKLGNGALADRMGIEIISVSAESVVGRMPVAGNTQPFGLLHGGATAVLAEQLGSLGALVHAGAQRYAVGIELSVSHHRAATDGFITATASALSLGRTSASYDIAVVDDEGRRIATARLTCLLRDNG